MRGRERESNIKISFNSPSSHFQSRHLWLAQKDRGGVGRKSRTQTLPQVCTWGAGAVRRLCTRISRAEFRSGAVAGGGGMGRK